MPQRDLLSLVYIRNKRVHMESLRYHYRKSRLSSLLGLRNEIHRKSKMKFRFQCK